MHNIVDIVLGLVEWMGYIGIFIMMVIESSFIPFPSEIAMVPAGYLASLGRMSLLGAFVAWTLWALVWASINYFGGRHLGKPVVKKLVHKYGKYVLLTDKHYKQVEDYFKSHGAITTLVWRFIPAVRQLISIPAGIFNMPYAKFLLYTGVWAWAWNAVLLAIGYIAGKNDELVRKLLSEVLLVTIVVLGIIVVGYVKYVKKHKKELIEIEEEIEHNSEKKSKNWKKHHKKKK